MKARRLVLGKRLATIFMSVAMVLIFMPIIGASIYSEAVVWDGDLRGWVNDSDPESSDEISADIDYGESVKLNVQAYAGSWVDDDSYASMPYNNVTYQWEKGEWPEDANEPVWSSIEGATQAYYTTGKLKKYSYYRCTINDNASETTESIMFRLNVTYIHVTGWANDNKENDSSYVHLEKYPGEVATLHIQAFTEFWDSEGEGVRTDYNDNVTYRWETGTSEYDAVLGGERWTAGEVITGETSSSYQITDSDVSDKETSYFRGYVIDNDGEVINYATFGVDILSPELYVKGWIKDKSEGDTYTAVNPGTAVTLNAEALTYDGREDKYVPITEDVEYQWSTGYWDDNDDSWVISDVISTQTTQGKPSSVTVRPNADTAYLCSACSDYYGNQTVSFYVYTNAKDVAGYTASEMINNLKPVEQLTLNDKDTVMKAKAAYDALSAEQRENWIDSSQETKLLRAVLRIQELQKQADDKAAADKAAAQVAAYKNTVTEAKALKVSGLKVKTKAKKATITWKVNKKATGYVVQYSMKKNFKKGTKKVNVKKAKTKKLVVKKLKAGKTYYFRIATYKQVKNPTTGKVVTTQGKWSKAKKVKVK